MFVLTGQSIDRNFYDNLNTYTGEAGSDGVVRVAAANMNYGFVCLTQQGSEFHLSKEGTTNPAVLGVLPGLSHSGTDMGIMTSVKADDDGSHPTVKAVLQCLSVKSAPAYRRAISDFAGLTTKTQDAERRKRTKDGFLFSRTFITDRYCMLVFRVIDDRGNELTDYDLVFTAGPTYDPDHLPPGFFVDRQRNSRSPGKLTYYVDYDVMADWFAQDKVADKFGFRVSARPDTGYAHYTRAEHRGTFSSLKKYFEPNRTLMIEFRLTRHVAEGVFRLSRDLHPADFRNQLKGADLPEESA